MSQNELIMYSNVCTTQPLLTVSESGYNVSPTPEAKELLEAIEKARNAWDDDNSYYPEWIDDLLYDCKAFIEATLPKQQGE